MATPKKAQKGASVKKNIQDATQMKNMRPVFKGPNSGPRVKPTLGGAKNGKSISKKAPCMSCGGKMSKKK